MSVRVRYAPSPTGALHVGSARTVLFNWLYARQTGGTFILRIEDTDQSRSQESHSRAQQDTLRWLGLSWDEGPDVGGAHGPYAQMERLPLYAEALERLRASGAAYPCFCSPEELAARRELARAEGRPPRYDGRCRHLSTDARAALQAEGRPPAWRLLVPADGTTVVHDLIRGDVAFPHATLDDFVLVRSDGLPTYNFAVAVDDAAMRITHVLRGDDHLANTPKQLLVYAALGVAPPAFGHLPSVLATDRSRLSKRHGSISVEDYRGQGLLPEGILNYCALLGWSPGDDREVMSLTELVAAFNLGSVGRSGAVYDEQKLRWINAQHLRRLPAAEVLRRAAPWLSGTPAGARIAAGAGPDAEAVARLVLDRVQTLREFAQAVEVFYTPPEAFEAGGVSRFFGSGAAALLRRLAEQVGSVSPWGEASVEAAYRGLADTLGVKPAALIHPTRLALTGRTVGPSLFALAALLGPLECAARLRLAADRLDQGTLPGPA